MTSNMFSCSGYKMKKRVGDVEEFAFEPLTDEPDVHVTIAVTGWLTEDEPGMSFPHLPPHPLQNAKFS